MHDVSSHLSEDLLNAYLLGTLRDDELESVEQHLSECRDCAAQAAEMQPRDSLMELLTAAAKSAAATQQFAGQATLGTLHARDISTSVCGTMLEADAAARSSDTEPIPPQLLNHRRYRVIRMLGRGGMGSVCLARHLLLGRLVALKMLRGDWMQKPSTVERFDREIRAAAKPNHSNIATVHDAEQIGDSHFLVMEYVDGQTLAEIVSHGPLPTVDACRAVRDAANGLAHAHAARLIHRDVKPGNMMRTSSGETKILDFGLVVSPEETSSLTAPNLVMGTPDYISPEQAEDPHSADERSDIYSLGCTLFHLLTGHVPFPESSVVRKIDAHRSIEPAAIETIPDGLWRLLSQMMDKEPLRRIQSAAQVAQELGPYCCEPNQEIQSQIETMLPSAELSNAAHLVSRDKLRKWLWYAIFSLAVLFTGAVYYIQTDYGELRINTVSDEISVVVRQSGRVVTIIDTRAKQRVRLRSGHYELEIQGNLKTLQIDGDQITLSRGKTAVAAISWIPTDQLHEKVDDLPRRPGDDPLRVRDFQVIHSAELPQLEIWLSKLTSGWIPVFMEASEGTSPPRFNAIAIKDDTVFESRLSLNLDVSGPPHMEDFNLMASDGWSLRTICTFDVDSNFGRHHVWVRDDPPWLALGQPFKEMDALLPKLRREGMRPIQIYRNALDTGRGSDSRPYAVLFASGDGVNWDVQIELSETELVTAIENARRNRQRPEMLNSFGRSDNRTYSLCLIGNGGNLRWDFRSRLTPTQLETSIAEDRSRGLRPVSITSEHSGNEDLFCLLSVEFAEAKNE